MNSPKTSLVERLCEAKNPCGFQDWYKRDGYYAAACRIAADDVPGLIEIVVNGSDSDWSSVGDSPNISQENIDMLPVTAWRTLADVRAEEAVEPLIDMLRDSDGEFYEWISEELHHVFGKIGKSAISSLNRIARDECEDEFVRIVAVHALRSVADYHGDTRDQVVGCLTDLMARAAEGEIEFNMAVFDQLIKLQAVEAAEAIQRAIALNLVDVSMPGDWEDARRLLAANGAGLSMPENSLSAELWLTELGGGIFSDEPIFADGEIDPDAEQAYYEQAYRRFSKSPEAKQVVDRYGNLGWFSMHLEHGLHYLGQTIDGMALESVEDFVLDYVPRKVSTSPKSAPEIIYELAKFWEYLDRVYELPEAKSIVAWLSRPDLVARLEAELSDTSNYGIAKSMVMMGTNAGYDLTSKEGCAEFMAAFNERMRAKNTPPATPPDYPEPALTTAPIRNDQRVGRNDPCPCGSGKKFKKCCR